MHFQCNFRFRFIIAASLFMYVFGVLGDCKIFYFRTQDFKYLFILLMRVETNEKCLKNISLTRSDSFRFGISFVFFFFLPFIFILEMLEIRMNHHYLICMFFVTGTLMKNIEQQQHSNSEFSMNQQHK